MATAVATAVAMWTRSAVVAAAVIALVTVGGTAYAGDDDVDSTPCSSDARACVDLDDGQAWLIEDGEIVRGPVPIGEGGEGHETPRGDFAVEWKNRDHHSAEFDAPMPLAVFFAPGGIAFHEGNVDGNSAGCVRLAHDDAQAFFDALEVGDRVEVR